MQLVLNGINGSYLRDLVAGAREETERVDAAVAYGTDNSLLFDWCHENGVPLRYWGRFDEGVPVALRVLKQFLQNQSGLFTCKLVRHLHAKVIWWRGYGVYIGSANLTQSAWWNNVEAGVFLTEYEISESGKGEELEEFFRIVDMHSSPLTDEIYRALELRQNQLNQIRKIDKNDATKIDENLNVKPWEGLSGFTIATADQRRRAAFLAEWNSTLQLMRGFAATVSSSYRPKWVSASTSSGAQVDQFLHAHYYDRTFDGNHANYESMYEQNRNSTNKAVTEAMEWWRNLEAAPHSEDVALNEAAPFLHHTLSRGVLRKMDEPTLTTVLQRIHAAYDYARRVPNAQVGLTGDRRYSNEEKIEALAKTIWKSRSATGRTIIDTVEFVLYGGPADELPIRLWEATNSPEYRLPNVGISTLGEMVGWALPDRFPPRNGRTSKALRSLGFDVAVHVG